MQESLCGYIESRGVELSKGDYSTLSQAIARDLAPLWEDIAAIKKHLGLDEEGG